MLAQKLKVFGFGSVLVITDSFDENLYLASRNLPNVLVVEPHQAILFLWYISRMY